MDIDLGRKEQSRLFGQLVQHTSDILWMFTGDWEELIFVNDRYEEVWGRSTDALEAEPTDFLEGVHLSDREQVRDAMTRLSDDEAVELEFRVNADEDYRRWVWVHGESITDEDDEVVRVAGFSRDVTERKARERDLRRSEQRYRQLLEISPAPIFIYTTDGELVYANEAAVEFLATDDRDAILGTTAGDFTHPESRDDIDARLE